MVLYIGGIRATSSNSSSGGKKYVINREVSAQGVYQMPKSDFTFSLPSGATDVGDYALYSAFYNCSYLVGALNLSSLISASGRQAMDNAFYNCTGLTSVDLSNLVIVGHNSGGTSSSVLGGAFSRCTGLTGALNLSSLTTVNSYSAMSTTFSYCTGLTSVDLSSLTTITGGRIGMSGTFQGCTKLTSVDLSSLAVVNGEQAMQSIFSGCTSLTSLSFPSLTSTSFGSYTNQFNNMLQGVTGCTVHFPSNLQSKIGSWSDVTAGFGGTNTTVLFDLTATS